MASSGGATLAAIKSLITLSVLYGLGMVGTPLLSLAATFAYLSLHTTMFVISQSSVAASLMYFLLCYLLLALPEQPSPAQSMATMAVAVAMVRVYEFYVIFGPLLIGLALWPAERLETSLRRMDRCVLLTMTWSWTVASLSLPTQTPLSTATVTF